MPYVDNNGSSVEPVSRPNQHLMQVKFHMNRFQDNLLTKRLQQLNSEEMKSRLKHQRTSNELILFLRECQKTTGYYSKMNPSGGGAATASFESKSFHSCMSDASCPSDKKSSATTTITTSPYRLNMRRPSTGVSSTSFRSNSYTNCFYTGSSSNLGSKLNMAKKEPPAALPNSASSSGCSQYSTSNKVASTSSRSDSSTYSSNSSESLCDDVEKKSAPLRVRPLTAHVPQPRRLFHPVANDPTRRKTQPNLNDLMTVSNLDWYSCQPVSSSYDFDTEIDVKSTRKQTPATAAATAKPTGPFTSTSNLNLSPAQYKSKSLNSMSLRNNSISSTTTSSTMTSTSSNTTTGKWSNWNKLKLPLKINMSRASMRKKQLEIMNEYTRYNTLELLNNLRQIQRNLDSKVKQFTSSQDNLSAKK